MVKIVFTASKSWISRVIRWFTKSHVSHVMIEFESKTFGGRWVLESTLQGVRILPAIKARHNVVAEYECLFNAEDALKKTINLVGNRYDFSGLFVFGLILLPWKLFKLKIKSPFKNTKGQLCSELIARALKNGKFLAAKTQGRVNQLDAQFADPYAIWSICEKSEVDFKKIEIVK